MQSTNEQGDSLQNLQASSHRGAVVSPIQKARMQDHILHLGVFEKDGTLLAESIEDRHHGTHLYQPADLSLYAQIKNAAEPEAIYAGVFFNHYGHFLLESLARLWFARDKPQVPIIWVGVDSWPRPPSLRSWQRDILNILKIRNPCRVLTCAERFNTLYMPEPGYRYADWCHPQHAAFLAEYGGPAQESENRLWLSRNDVGNQVGIVNSRIFEHRLEQNGWTVMCPEKLSVPEQLDAMARASIVGGEEGSAFHSLLLLRDISQKKFHIFKRHGAEHMSFHTIGKARNVDQVFHSTSEDAVLSISGREVRRLAPSSAPVLKRLSVPVRKVSIKDPAGNASVRRLQRIIEGRKSCRYLEFGVANGATFLNIKAENRVGVDPALRFDGRSFSDSTTSFYEVSPSDYAAYFGGAERFDIIFINNIHSFDDALQAFTAAISLSHEKTVIMIDNVFPVDEFSAMRDQKMALMLRQKSGSARKAWHGDVYKLIFFIKNFFLQANFLTIETGGNAQALVWKEPRLKQDSSNMKIEEIASMTYAEMKDQLSAFNFTTEDRAIEKILKI